MTISNEVRTLWWFNCSDDDCGATIEAAARAIYDVRDDPYDDDEWEEMDSTDREECMCQARAALTAAAPYIQAAALRDAARTGNEPLRGSREHPARLGWRHIETTTKEEAVTEYERRCRRAAHELRIMRGNGVIDLNRIDQILDPDGSFSLLEKEGEK